jgi:hypothetical protein
VLSKLIVVSGKNLIHRPFHWQLSSSRCSPLSLRLCAIPQLTQLTY